SDLGGSAGLLIGFSLIGFWSFLQANCIKIFEKCRTMIDRRNSMVEAESPIFLRRTVPPQPNLNDVVNRLNDMRNEFNEIRNQLNETNETFGSRMNALEQQIRNS